MTKYTLVITEEAEYDLNNLYVDGFRRWGEAQADKYYDNLLAHFNAICDNPYLYPAVDEIRKGYRRGIGRPKGKAYREGLGFVSHGLHG